MAAIDEILSIEEALKKAKFLALEARTKAKKIADQIVGAEKRLVGVKKSLENCMSVVRRAKGAEVVVLYTKDGEKGEWLKAQELVRQNEELVRRIQTEIGKLQSVLRAEEEAALGLLDEEVERLQRQLDQYGIVKEFKRDDR